MVFASPFSPTMLVLNENIPSFSDYYPPSITEHDKILQEIVNIVPRDASILTQSNVFPHLSNRVNAYAYPDSVILERASPDEMDSYIDEIIQKSEFILMDALTDPSASTAVLAKADALGTYGIYAYADGIYLLKNGFQGDPVFSIP